MPSWLITTIAVMCVLALVGLAIWGMAKDRKKGSSPCGGRCGSCPYGGSCPSVKK